MGKPFLVDYMKVVEAEGKATVAVDFPSYALALEGYVRWLEGLLKEKRLEIAELKAVRPKWDIVFHGRLKGTRIIVKVAMLDRIRLFVLVGRCGRND